MAVTLCKDCVRKQNESILAMPLFSMAGNVYWWLILFAVFENF